MRQAWRDSPGTEAAVLRKRGFFVMIMAGWPSCRTAELTLSEATIKTHVARILATLQLRDRVQAVVVAYETGLVGPASQQS
jgi:hypothetical protein